MPTFSFVSALSGEELMRYESEWPLTLAELHTYFADCQENWHSVLLWKHHVSKLGDDCQRRCTSSVVLDSDAAISVVAVAGS